MIRRRRGEDDIETKECQRHYEMKSFERRASMRLYGQAERNFRRTAQRHCGNEIREARMEWYGYVMRRNEG